MFSVPLPVMVRELRALVVAVVLGRIVRLPVLPIVTYLGAEFVPAFVSARRPDLNY